MSLRPAEMSNTYYGLFDPAWAGLSGGDEERAWRCASRLTRSHTSIPGMPGRDRFKAAFDVFFLAGSAHYKAGRYFAFRTADETVTAINDLCNHIHGRWYHRKRLKAPAREMAGNLAFGRAVAVVAAIHDASRGTTGCQMGAAGTALRGAINLAVLDEYLVDKRRFA